VGYSYKTAKFGLVVKMKKFADIFFVLVISAMLALPVCAISLPTVGTNATGIDDQSTQAIVSVVVPNDVAFKQTFEVSVYISPDIPIAGAQVDLLFDPNLVSVLDIKEGNLFSQNGDKTYFVYNKIDNEEGLVSGIVGVILGENKSVTNVGTLAVIVFESKDVAGTIDYKLDNVIIGNTKGEGITTSVKENLTIVSPARAEDYTFAISLPTVVTNGYSSPTTSTVILSGSITNTGGENCTTIGFLYGTSPGNLDQDVHQDGDYGAITFSTEVTELSTGTTYYFRAYATNSAGTNFGDELAFSTLAGEAQAPEEPPPFTTTETAPIVPTSLASILVKGLLSIAIVVVGIVLGFRFWKNPVELMIIFIGVVLMLIIANYFLSAIF
jgi:hypothetical protein